MKLELRPAEATLLLFVGPLVRWCGVLEGNKTGYFLPFWILRKNFDLQLELASLYHLPLQAFKPAFKLY